MRPFAQLFLSVLSAGLCLEVGAQWNLVQNATQQSPTCIRLTNAINQQRGAAWHDCQIHLGAEFDLEFTVNLGTNNGGADGMCFVLQQEGNVGNNLIGGNGGDIGYTGSPFIPSIAVEIDTYQNGNVGDPSFDHIAIQSNGSTTHNLSPAVQASATTVNIENGQSYPFRVTWNPSTTTLQVYFDGVLRKTLTLDLTNSIFFGDPLVYWGFTGTTGGVNNVHTFCLVDAYYSTHIETVEASPEGPWQVCEGEELDLTAVPLPPSVDAIWEDSGVDVLTVTSAGTYALYAEDAEGCPTHNEVEVTSAPGPELSLLVDPDLVVCGDPSTVLSASVADGAAIAWEGQAGPDLTVQETGVYEVVGELNDCVQTEEVNVLFQPIPVIEFAVEGEVVSGDVELCFGDFVTLDVSATDGGVAEWDNNGLNALDVTSSGDYFATAVANGCEAQPDFLHVDLLPLPVADITASPPALCWQTTGQVGTDLGEGAVVTGWELPPGTSSLGQAGPGLYQVALESTNGCVNTESFTYSMLPPIATGLVNPEPLCDEGVAMLSVTGNVDQLSWNVGGNGANLPVVASMGEGPFVANVTLGYCSQSDTAYVTWWPTPSVGSQPDSVSRCVLDPAYPFIWPTQTSPAVGTWVWSVNGEPATAGYSATTEGTYLIEVRDNATGCLDTHEMKVNVLPNLNVVATPADPLICIGDSTEVQVELLPVLETDPFEIPFTLLWSTEGASGWSNNVVGGEHYVTATNACGTSVALAEVEEEYCGCHVWVPNAFTPDGDGLNEGFRIVSSCEWDAFQFQVFNRWGEQVWSTDDPNRPWDGGAPDVGGGDHYLPDGWYPYLVQWEYRDNGIFYREQKTGRILIVR